MIVKDPHKVDSFSRCECTYSLLEFEDKRCAIQWDCWSDGIPPYAIMYDKLVQVLEDWNNLRLKKIGYWDIANRTAKENILDVCWWEEDGDEIIRIEKLENDECWVIFPGAGVRMGPFPSAKEAAYNVGECFKTVME